MEDLDIYDDLEEFQQVEEKKSKELEAWESKYNESLQTIESKNKEIETLKKQIKTMKLNFQILLDTSRAEINRKDKLMTQLRQEKDDICFRRKPPRNYREEQTQQIVQPPHEDIAFGSNLFNAEATVACAQQSENNLEVSKQTHNRARRRERSRDNQEGDHRSRDYQERGYRSPAHDSMRRGDYSISTAGDHHKLQLNRRNSRDDYWRRDHIRDRDFHEDEDRERSGRNSRNCSRDRQERERRFPVHSSNSRQSYQHHSRDRYKHTSYNLAQGSPKKQDDDCSSSSSKTSSTHGQNEREFNRRHSRNEYRHTDDKSSRGSPEKLNYKSSSSNINLCHKTQENLKDKPMERKKDMKKEYANKERPSHSDIKDKRASKEQKQEHKKVTLDCVDPKIVKECEGKSIIKEQNDKQHKTLKTAENPNNKKEDKQPNVEFNVEKSNNPRTEQKLIKATDLKNDGHISTKAILDEIQKHFEIPKILLNAKETKIEISPISSNDNKIETKVPKQSELFLTPLITKAKPQLSKETLNAEIIQKSDEIPSVKGTVNNSTENRDENSNYNKALIPTTPKNVAIFEALFGCTPPNSTESVRSRVGNSLLTNESITTSPSMYSDISDVVSDNNLITVKVKEQSMTAEDIDGYFTTNEHIKCEKTEDLKKKIIDVETKEKTAETTETTVSSLSAFFVNSVEQPIPGFGDFDVVENVNKTKDKTAETTETTVSSLSVIFGNSVEQSRPALDDLDVKENVVTLENPLVNSVPLKNPKIESFMENSEVIEIEDDSEVENTDEKEQRYAYDKVNEKEVVDSVTEAVKVVKPKVENKKSRIEIIEVIRLPGLFELQNKTENSSITNENRTVDVNVFQKQGNTCNADANALINKVSEVKIEEELERKKSEKVKPKVDGDITVIDTIDISDDNDYNERLLVDYTETDMAVGVIGDKKVITEKDKITKKASTFKKSNESTEKLETIVNNKNTCKSLEDLNTIETVSKIYKTNQAEDKFDKNVNNNLLDQKSNDINKSKAITTVTANCVTETIPVDIVEAPNVMQRSLKQTQQVTTIKDKELIEKDGIIYEIATITEITEKFTSITDVIEENDSANKLKRKDSVDFSEIGQEMAKMHNTPKGKAEDTQQLSECTTPGSRDFEKHLNTYLLPTKSSTLTSQIKDDDATTTGISETESSSITEKKASLIESEDEIHSALAQLRELQNRSESRCKSVYFEKDEDKKVTSTEDAVAFVIENYSSANIPAGNRPLTKTKSTKNTKNKNLDKIVISTNSNKEQKQKSTQRPKVNPENHHKIVKEESVDKSIASSTCPPDKSKTAERKVNKSEVKIILPRKKKSLQKNEANKLVKLNKKVVTTCSDEKYVDDALCNAKVKDILVGYKIPKKDIKSKFGINKVVSNIEFELANCELPLKKIAPDVEKEKVEHRLQQTNKQKSNIAIAKNSHLTVGSAEKSAKIKNNFEHATIPETIDNKTSKAMVEDINELQTSKIKEKDNQTVNDLLNTEGKKGLTNSHNKTENITVTTNISGTPSLATSSPAHSAVSSDDYSAVQNQIHRPKNNTLKRRILDTSSEEDFKKAAAINVAKKMSTQKHNPPKVVTPQRELKRKLQSPIAQLAEEIEEQFKKDVAIRPVDKKRKISQPAVTSSISQAIEGVAIFETDISTSELLPAMSPANTSQDAQFREIDSRLQSMFQSPPYICDYLESTCVDETFDNTFPNNGATQTNLTVDESVAQDASSAPCNTTLLNNSGSLSSKHMSLGKSDYRFEKISDNVVNIFITRRRGKKRQQSAGNNAAE